MKFLAIFLVIVSVSFDGLGQVYLKKAALNEANRTRYLIYNSAGIALLGLEALVWTIVLSMLDLSVAFPLEGLSFVATAIFSLLLLREKIHARRWAGIACILAGTVLLAN